MYFSKHNEKTVYINHYSGLLEVEGEGPLCKEDAEAWPTSGRNWQSEYNVLSVKEGITGLGEGYLESFPKIGCLILSRTVESVATTPELDKRLCKNKVLIRGEYDTYAEEFAREKGLKFLHCDIHLADDDIEIAHEHDIITLRFHEKGTPDIHYNCFTPGSSAGSYGGGEYCKELPGDFYVGCSMEQFADNFPERLRQQLMGNEMLRRFLSAANSRNKES
ncbi:MAG: hypothetical protein IJT49_04445 [Clostridia bacterium]|nr:hypothetical protein [Clostridia bacterium]